MVFPSRFCPLMTLFAKSARRQWQRRYTPYSPPGGPEPDLALLTRTIAALREPVDRYLASTRPLTIAPKWCIGARVRDYLLEGWCIGIPQPDEALVQPLMRLRPIKMLIVFGAPRSAAGRDYATLFADLDACSKRVSTWFNWRWQQEQQLSRRFRPDHPP